MLWLDVFICCSGLALHGAMKWGRYRQEFEPIGPLEYLARTPAQSAISVIATISAFSVSYALEWLNPGLAFACGYAGNSIAENIASQFAKPG